MQVLWVSHLIPYPPKAGVLLRAYNLLKGVAQQHTVDLVAFIQEPWLTTLFPSRDAGLAECERELGKICRSVSFLPIERLARPYGKLRTAAECLLTGDGYMADWLHSAQASQRIAALQAAHKYDLAHFDTICLAGYRESLTGVPATLGHHNVESHMMLRRASNEKNLVKKAYFWQEGRRLQSFERRVAPQFQAQIMCSDMDAQRLGEIVPQVKTYTVPNGVDCDYFKPRGVPLRPYSMIFVGTMNWYPNVAAVLFLLREIWPIIKRAQPLATLDIVGANAPQSVRDASRGLDGVKLLGFVPEVRPLMESAAVYVCPIRDGGGTKLKILDACAMQNCIVAHPIACEGISVNPGKNVVFAETAQQFADSTVTLFGDVALAKKIGEAARQLVLTDYSFAAISRNFATILEQIAAAGVSHRR